jgi:hypothetical protein
MNKISAEQKEAILAEVPQVLRSLAEERDMYRDKCAAYELRTTVDKLAGQMIDKGLETGTVQELADRLEKQASTGQVDLKRMSDAVELVGPNMGKFAHVADEIDGSASTSELERFLLS